MFTFYSRVPIVPSSTRTPLMNQVVKEESLERARRCHACKQFYDPSVVPIAMDIFGFICDKCKNSIPGLWSVRFVNGHDSCPVWEPSIDHEYILESWKRANIPKKEYWYFLTWTLAPGKTIEDVRANIKRFTERDLGFIACDIVLEHGEDTGRPHYHMRVKLEKPLKKQKVQHYARTSGHVDVRPIKKQTQANWDDGLEGYMSKENAIEKLI